MATAKKWAHEEGIPVQDVEYCLDSELFLDEYPRWKTDGPQCPCMLQRMFAYAKEVGQKEWEWTIHWGHQQPVPRVDAKAKTMVGWWDSGPQGRGSKGSIMRYTSKRGYWAPHCMGQSGWRPLIRKSLFPWKSRHGRCGYCQARRRSEGSHCKHFVAQPPGQIPLPDPDKEWGTTWPGPQGS